MKKKKSRVTVFFNPSELKRLPNEMHDFGKILKSIFNSFNFFASETLPQLGYTLPGNYCDFLENELAPLIAANDLEIKKELSHSQPIGKVVWQYRILNITLRVIEDGHEGLSESFEKLINGNIAEFISSLSHASSNLGRLAMTHAMCGEGFIQGIGSQHNKIFRGKVGGTNSGKTRAANALLPMTPEELRAEKEDWISKGHASRDAASFLANKYRCTPDHVRKHLNKARSC